MIQFEPLIPWTWAWLFALTVGVVLGVQIFWIFNAELKSARKAIKIGLNALFCMVLIGYVFQPVWSTDSPKEAILVYSNSINRDEMRFWKDSLDIKKAVEIRKYQGKGNALYLLGSDFSEAELLNIRENEIQWISDFKEGTVSYLEWKGILREGEMQLVKGRLETDDTVRIAIVQEGETLAEVNTETNAGIFKLEFPVSVLGRNQLELSVNDSLLGYVNFYAQAAKPLQYSLQFSFPDAEIRNLSQYLIKSGEQVNERIDVSRNSTVLSGNSDSDSLHFLIIDPGQLGKKSTKEAIAKGASVLLINLNDVNSDIRAINKSFETSFAAKRTENSEQRTLEDDLEAQPYEFDAVTAQKLLFENAFAVQQIGSAKVGVSLLGKTFPIKLAGDSLRYQAIWQQLLGAMIPQESGAINISQPVFKGMETEIQVNQHGFAQEFIRIDSDSVFLQPSLVNPFARTASFIGLGSGWISIGDSLEFYSYEAEEWPSLQAARFRADFLALYSKNRRAYTGIAYHKGISDWFWFGLFMLLLSLIWLEPKVLI